MSKYIVLGLSIISPRAICTSFFCYDQIRDYCLVSNATQDDTMIARIEAEGIQPSIGDRFHEKYMGLNSALSHADFRKCRWSLKFAYCSPKSGPEVINVRALSRRSCHDLLAVKSIRSQAAQDFVLGWYILFWPTPPFHDIFDVGNQRHQHTSIFFVSHVLS